MLLTSLPLTQGTSGASEELWQSKCTHSLKCPRETIPPQVENHQENPPQIFQRSFTVCLLDYIPPPRATAPKVQEHPGTGPTHRAKSYLLRPWHSLPATFGIAGFIIEDARFPQDRPTSKGGQGAYVGVLVFSLSLWLKIMSRPLTSLPETRFLAKFAPRTHYGMRNQRDQTQPWAARDSSQVPADQTLLWSSNISMAWAAMPTRTTQTGEGRDCRPRAREKRASCTTGGLSPEELHGQELSPKNRSHPCPPPSFPSTPSALTRIYRQQRRHLGGVLTERSCRTEAPEKVRLPEPMPEQKGTTVSLRDSTLPDPDIQGLQNWLWVTDFYFRSNK